VSVGAWCVGCLVQVQQVQQGSRADGEAAGVAATVRRPTDDEQLSKASP
jgi:hypothetical protein